MRILYINHYAGSPVHGMEYRPYYLSREWVRSGHRVRIVAASFSHIRSKQPKMGDAVERRSIEIIDGIEYVWYGTPVYQGNGLGRALNILVFLHKVWHESKWLVDGFQPDAVIASSTYPMDIWVAQQMAARAKAKLVFEVHDLWPLTPIELYGMPKCHPFVFLCRRAENIAYQNADVVVSMLPKVHGYMKVHGLDLRKLHFIPNGIAADEWEGERRPLSNELEAYIRTVHDQGDLLVGYAGAHGLPNALDTLLDTAGMLKNEPIRFLLVGDGHEKRRLEQRVANEGLGNVQMFAPVPKSQIPALLERFDIAYLGWQHKPIYRFGIAPNKLMDYMMSSRVILHSVKAGNDPVAEAGCGVTVAPESPDDNALGLKKLAAMSASERESMGSKGRAYVQKFLTYPVLARRFVEAIN